MPDNRNRKRPIQVKFFVDEKELSLIKARMAQLGIENMSAYLRKMAIDGYAVLCSPTKSRIEYACKFLLLNLHLCCKL